MSAADEDPELMTPGYKAPAKVDLETLKNLDAEDESLNKWKAQLLAGGAAGNSDDPRKVIVEKMSLICDGRPDVELDLTGDLSTLKGRKINIKEGCTFRLKITFKVQHEVVAGLRYLQKNYRGGVPLPGSVNNMLGSYGPKGESQVAFTPWEECPKGMMARASYTAKSKFIDDDKDVHLAWDWTFKIAKDW